MKGTSAWLSVAERDLIIDSALRILATVGMRMADARALDALEREGARVDRHAGVVRFPEELVRRALGSLPDTLLMAGVTPELDVVLDRRSGPRF
ncbi:MAG: trimethylamine methyltransferase family protein, partial [Actinobacteria bacterium]|nr:trimethylamine methyltransferase family protein [Actinomycetota bacterium]